ncbi:hypothetical protein [Halorussus salinus]|uniref:hypothetical protein n=1 Tax=Halorussus salinus TaxID=1364935 RepID=UPI0010932E60|nr:hypothetical protein [Halorussus salinus]
MSDEETKINIEDSEASPIAVREATKEGRKTLEQQVSTLADIDEKAIRIYRADVLLLSVIIGAMSLASDGSFSYFANLNSVSGLLLLIGAIALAGVTYTYSDLEIGVTQNDIKDVVEDDYESDDLYLRLASGYAEWIDENGGVLESNGKLMICTIIVEIGALAYLSGGVIVTVVANTGLYFLFTHTLLVFLCLVALFWNKIIFLGSWSIRKYIVSFVSVLLLSMLVLIGSVFITPLPDALHVPLQTWSGITPQNKKLMIDIQTFLLILLTYPFIGYSIYNLEF